MKLKIFLIFAALIASTGNSLAAPIISPYAADLSAGSYTASGQYLSYSAQNAFNGGLWIAPAFGAQWIQADLGATFTLSEVQLVVNQSPNGPSWHQVFISDSFIGSNWSSLTAVASHSGYTTSGQLLDLTFVPTQGRYLEIVTYSGANWWTGGSWAALGDGNAVTRWTDPASQNQNIVPEPGTWLLLGSGLVGLVAFRKRLAARA